MMQNSTGHIFNRLLAIHSKFSLSNFYTIWLPAHAGPFISVVAEGAKSLPLRNTL